MNILESAGLFFQPPKLRYELKYCEVAQLIWSAKDLLTHRNTLDMRVSHDRITILKVNNTPTCAVALISTGTGLFLYGRKDPFGNGRLADVMLCGVIFPQTPRLPQCLDHWLL